MKKVACYLRCSTDKQNLETQRQIMQSFIASKGWDADYFEEVESSRATRPVKMKMMARLTSSKEYAGCIVTKLDRFARSSRELITNVELLLKRGCFFISIGDSLDFTSAAGRLQFQILSAFAEFERSLIAQRTSESLQRLKSTGRILGRPKGSKDKKHRAKAGYFVREAKKRQAKSEAGGVFRSEDKYFGD